jgi:hypothetical protein
LRAIPPTPTPTPSTPIACLDAGHAGRLRLVFAREETASERAHIEIRVEPTAPAIALDSTQPTVPAGVWLITVKHEAGPRLVIDAFIERDDTLRGRRSMGRQSYFDDPRYRSRDRFGRIQEFEPSYTSSYVVRRGTLNGDASGKESYVIGAFRRFPQSPRPSPYTSAGPIAPRRGFAPLPLIFAAMIADRFAAY